MDRIEHRKSPRVRNPSLDRSLMCSYTRVYGSMSKSVRVSEEFHAFVKAHKREDETMEETLRRLIGGPNPETVAGILSSETAEHMRERLEKKRDRDVSDKHELRERFE